VIAALVITACGGGGGGGGGFLPLVSIPPASTPTFSIGGTVSGLTGTLVLRNNGADESSISANGSFSFTQALPNGATYEVTVRTQPDGQVCTLAGASGIVNAAVTSVVATCAADPSTALPPVPASPVVGYAPKAFLFSWANVPQATYYRLGEDPTNSGAFSLLADNLAGTSHALRDLVLSAPPAAYRYALQACNRVGCSAWSAPVLPDATKAIGYFKRPAGAGAGLFGSIQSSVALSPDGMLMAVAQPDGGMIHLYRRDAGEWAWLQTLHDPDPGFMPSSLSFSGEGTMLAGSPQDGSGVSKVNVYTRGASSVWSFDQTWLSQGPRSWDSFGQSVSISLDGNVAVVSEIGGSPSFPPGAFYVYRKTAGQWAVEQRIESPAAQSLDLFGVYASISADGSTVVVGAQYENSGALSKTGAAYIYSRPAGATAWALNTRLEAAVPLAGAWFGTSVGVSGNGDVVAVGARNEADAGLSAAGALYLFRRNGASYQLEQRLSAPVPQTGAAFGGYAAVFSGDGSLLATSAQQDGATSAGVNGSTAPGGNNVGAAFLYEKRPSGWQLKTFIKAPNPGNGDVFGNALAMSADGKTLAIGARNEASAATGIGGDQADNSADVLNRGAVYLY
jgi:FG-GAP repeat